MSSKLIRWLAYLAGWLVFALFFISQDTGRLLYQGQTVQWHGYRGLADDRLCLGSFDPIRLVARRPLPVRAKKLVA